MNMSFISPRYAEQKFTKFYKLSDSDSRATDMDSDPKKQWV